MNEYPTEEQLEAIRTFWASGWSGIVPKIRAAYNEHYGHVVLENGKDVMGRRVRRLTLITGGWSGNEDVIQAVEDNTRFMMMCWRSSHRGGRYVYEWRAKWQ